MPVEASGGRVAGELVWVMGTVIARGPALCNQSNITGTARAAPAQTDMKLRLPWPTLAVLGALAAAALVVRNRTRSAERLNPPSGRFLVIDGVRLHYVERGEGAPVVLLHGNGTMIQDFDL